ncbi:unnamed protein product, partial [Auanema sp. JU1783]
ARQVITKTEPLDVKKEPVNKKLAVSANRRKVGLKSAVRKTPAALKSSLKQTTETPLVAKPRKKKSTVFETPSLTGERKRRRPNRYSPDPGPYVYDDEFHTPKTTFRPRQAGNGRKRIYVRLWH